MTTFRQYEALSTDEDIEPTELELKVMQILVDSELPICEECGSGTYTWEEAQEDRHIMSQKAYTAKEIIEAVLGGTND